MVASFLATLWLPVFKGGAVAGGTVNSLIYLNTGRSEPPAQFAAQDEAPLCILAVEGVSRVSATNSFLVRVQESAKRVFDLAR